MGNERGFKLIELIIAIAVLSVIAALALPSFVKAREKSRENEVKRNLHIIQVALERYGTDHEQHFPPFLIGGEADYNIVKSHIDPRYTNAARIKSGVTPFAKRRDESLADREYCALTMDPLIFYGYIKAYPQNPFADRVTRSWHAALGEDEWDLSGRFPYGGLYGDRMFDLGFGYGDTPQTDFILSGAEIKQEAMDDGETCFADPDLDAPGNFFYEPFFNDERPVYLHYLAEYNIIYSGHPPDVVYQALDNNWRKDSLKEEYLCPFYSSRPYFYILYSYGSPRERKKGQGKGWDVFNRMPDNTVEPYGKFKNIAEIIHDDDGLGLTLFIDSAVEGSEKQRRVETTGYSSCAMYDPWTGAFMDGVNPDDPGVKYKQSGGDGILDWIISECPGGPEMYLDKANIEYLYDWVYPWERTNGEEEQQGIHVDGTDGGVARGGDRDWSGHTGMGMPSEFHQVAREG